MSKFPCPVQWKDRHYEVQTDAELSELTEWLSSGRIALANRYRVSDGPSRWRRALPFRSRVKSTVTIHADVWKAVGVALVEQAQEIRKLRALLSALSPSPVADEDGKS